MDLLKISNLTISFKSGGRKVKVVDGVSFDIMEDEVVGLIGESGSGKTLTGFSILGILSKEAAIEKGMIIFEGRDILKLQEQDLRGIRAKKIGIVFQEPFTSLNPVLKVGYQIDETLLAHGDISKGGAKRKTMLLLEKVRLRDPERIYNSYPHQLSGGQRQRVMIAIAISLNPRLLIADEPTTALDVTVQAEILKLLRTLKDELKMSILFITHDFGIINEMADRVVVMRKGKIIEEGKKEHLLKFPKDTYTKDLIEAVPRIGKTGDMGKMPEHEDILVETKGLTKSFVIERGFLRKEIGKVHAVKDVNLKIKKGETVGLVGETGCGKSTLGRLLLGLEKPDSGEIYVDGRTFSKGTIKKIREMMQIIFQDPYSSLDPRLRMGEIVLEGASLLGLGKEDRGSLLKDILLKVHLSYDDRFKYPHQFSGGQRQRIAIARALVVSPKFLVLDEPVSSLDVLIQKDILALLKDLRKNMGLTYLFISHDLRVIESISDTVYVMCKGEIVEFGSREEIYKNAKHPYTKRLIESIPVF